MHKIFEHVRKSKGLTRVKLAKLASVGVKTIYNIEKGICIARRETIEMLNKVLGLCFSYEDYYYSMKRYKESKIEELINNGDITNKYEYIKNKLYEAERLCEKNKKNGLLEIYSWISIILHKEIDELIKAY